MAVSLQWGRDDRSSIPESRFRRPHILLLMFNAEVLQAGGQSFEVPGPDHSHIFISSKEHLIEVRNAGRDELSMFGATKQMFQPTYTMLGHNWMDERGAEGIGYVRAVGNLFPRQLLNIMPEMNEIVQQSFTGFVESHKARTGNANIPAYAMNKIMLTKLNTYCFFGDELGKCRNRSSCCYLTRFSAGRSVP
jgi:hypothetical protein